jgi:hypothetical protein
MSPSTGTSTKCTRFIATLCMEKVHRKCGSPYRSSNRQVHSAPLASKTGITGTCNNMPASTAVTRAAIQPLARASTRANTQAMAAIQAYTPLGAHLDLSRSCASPFGPAIARDTRPLAELALCSTDRYASNPVIGATVSLPGKMSAVSTRSSTRR